MPPFLENKIHRGNIRAERQYEVRKVFNISCDFLVQLMPKAGMNLNFQLLQVSGIPIYHLSWVWFSCLTKDLVFWPMHLYMFFFKILFIYSWETQRERDRERETEREREISTCFLLPENPRSSLRNLILEFNLETGWSYIDSRCLILHWNPKLKIEKEN